MSTTIDERVVEMRFDNRQFEAGEDKFVHARQTQRGFGSGRCG